MAVPNNETTAPPDLASSNYGRSAGRPFLPADHRGDVLVRTVPPAPNELAAWHGRPVDPPGSRRAGPEDGEMTRRGSAQATTARTQGAAARRSGLRSCPEVPFAGMTSPYTP